MGSGTMNGHAGEGQQQFTQNLKGPLSVVSSHQLAKTGVIEHTSSVKSCYQAMSNEEIALTCSYSYFYIV
jgi:hypothetical protein